MGRLVGSAASGDVETPAPQPGLPRPKPPSHLDRPRVDLSLLSGVDGVRSPFLSGRKGNGGTVDWGCEFLVITNSPTNGASSSPTGTVENLINPEVTHSHLDLHQLQPLSSQSTPSTLLEEETAPRRLLHNHVE